MNAGGTELREVLDRVRRIETRVTKIGRGLGLDGGGGKPVWDPQGRVVIPSPNCSIGECLGIVPAANRDSDVEVYVGDDYLMTFFVAP